MLDIIPGLILLVAVIFIFLIIVLNKILYKPLLTFMSDRDKSIQSDTLQAKNNSSNVAQLNEEALKIIHDAKTKASNIRESAVQEAKTKVAKEIESKKMFMEKKYDLFISKLENEKRDLKVKLSESLPLFQKTLKTKLNQI